MLLFICMYFACYHSWWNKDYQWLISRWRGLGQNDIVKTTQDCVRLWCGFLPVTLDTFLLHFITSDSRSCKIIIIITFVVNQDCIMTETEPLKRFFLVPTSNLSAVTKHIYASIIDFLEIAIILFIFIIHCVCYIFNGFICCFINATTTSTHCTRPSAQLLAAVRACAAQINC